MPVLTERSALVTSRSGKKKKKKKGRTPANATAPKNLTQMDLDVTAQNLGDVSCVNEADVLGNSNDDQAPNNWRLKDGAPPPGFDDADTERERDPRLIQAASARSNNGVKGKLKNKKVKK